MECGEFKSKLRYLQRWSERAADLGWVRQSDERSGRRYRRRRRREAIGASYWCSGGGVEPTRSLFAAMKPRNGFWVSLEFLDSFSGVWLSLS